MVEFPKYVKINDLDLVMAIREGMNPMLEWYDKKHNNLPYFWNYISGPKYGNSHHKSYSCVHSMGRWLDALVNAEAITGEVVPQEIYDQLAFWAYEIFNNDTGMMANLNVNTFEWEKVCDLHNLREAMYAFVALLKKNPNDQKAKKGAEHLIDMVDRYTDFETGNWKTDLYERECGGKVECGASSEREVYRFSSTLGRYIGGLVRLYMVYPYDKALDQAIRLTDTALKNVLLDDGEFDRERFAEHLHSTSSMISGIAMLGSLIQNQEVLCRVKKFMENGYYQIATDFGWCLENDKRVDNWVGEINNTGDYLEACLCLGKAGYEEYYNRADKMIRCHLLPSQLLDVSFISDEESEDDSISKMATRMKGAFGFPCPYGHEYEPGSEISFNWDIVGGGVSSLCWAYNHIVTNVNGIISVNLQFDYEDEKICYRTPYSCGEMKILLKEDRVVRCLMPKDVDWNALIKELNRQSILFYIEGQWLYLYGIYQKGMLRLPVKYLKQRKKYSFRNNELLVDYVGNRIVGMSSEGKRLCFFKEVNK